MEIRTSDASAPMNGTVDQLPNHLFANRVIAPLVDRFTQVICGNCKYLNVRDKKIYGSL